MKRIVILGGGSAGVMFANRMRKLVTQEEAEITVIEKSREHIYQPAFTLVVFGLDEPENLVRPMEMLFHEGIRLVFDEATRIDPENNRVSTEKNGEFSYDYLVVATGARLNYEEPQGMKEALEKEESVFTFYTLEGAVKLRDALKEMKGGTIACSVCDMPIRCPAAPMKFMMMAEDTARKKGVRDRFKFEFTTTLPVCFSREPYVSELNRIFAARDIGNRANFMPVEVDAGKGVVRDYGGGEVHFDLLCIIPLHEGQRVIQDSEGMGDETGWVTCDKNLMVHKKYSNIYSIGDATDFPTSKTGSGARKQAKILSEKMQALIRGKEYGKTYDGEIICPILTRHQRVMIAQFNYYESISPAMESYANWVLKVHMLRPLYWNLMVKGLL